MRHDDDLDTDGTGRSRAAGCSCGCGRRVRGLRLRAADGLARRMRTDLAVFRAARADGVPCDGAELDALVAGAGPLLEQLTARVHGDAGGSDVDKRAVTAWLRRAEGPRREISCAAVGGLTGPLGAAVEIFYAGVRSPGRIVAVRDTGMTVNTQVRAEVTVEVHPPGEEAVVLTHRVLVSRIAFPRVGDRVEVGVDPADPDRFAWRPAPGGGEAPTERQGADAGVVGPAERVALLRELGDLHRAGVLSDEEFGAEKRRLLGAG